MKLRQKLAAVLAATMLATSVPVVTMAASTNTITRQVLVVNEKESFSTVATASQVKVDFKDFDTINGETFYLELENAEWNTIDNAGVNKLKDGAVEWSAPAGVTATAISKTVVKVDVATGYAVANALQIPLLTTVKTGDATVAIKTMGSHSSITEGKWIFATTSDKVAVATVGTVPSIYTNGKIAELKFTEAFKGSIANTANYATVELQDSDFEFNLGTAAAGEYIATKDSSGKITGFTAAGTSTALKYNQYQVNANFGYGFSGHTATTVDIYVPVNDGAVAVIELKGNAAPDSLGVITLKELAVRSTNKAPQTGELKADISGAVDTQSNVAVAKIAAYGTTLAVKDDKAVEILAGQSKDVEFTLSENVEDSIVANREVTFTLDKGYFALEGATKADSIANLKASIAVLQHVDNDGGVENHLEANIIDVVVKDDKVIGFELKLPAALVNTEIDEFTVKSKVFIGLGEEGSVTLKAEGRALIEAIQTVVVEAKKAITVTSEPVVLKVGLKEQKGGKIAVTEADKAIFKNGQKLEITLPFEQGMTFAGEPEVAVTGDVQTGEVELVDVKDIAGKVIGRKVTVEIKRTSKVASTITLSNFEIDTDRTLPEGKFEVELGGEAVTANGDTLEIKDFVVVGTPNTQDLAKNGLRKGLATFVIGESKYTVNGVGSAMTAASYIQNPGYTMVPVRFVVEAFGVQDRDILFSAGTVTIFAGERTIQLKNGSDIAIVNGAAIKMETKVVIKEGRTYAPIGEVSKILGIEKAWDASSKTATFENK